MIYRLGEKEQGIILGKLQREVGSLLILGNGNGIMIEKRPFQLHVGPQVVVESYLLGAHSI